MHKIVIGIVSKYSTKMELYRQNKNKNVFIYILYGFIKDCSFQTNLLSDKIYIALAKAFDNVLYLLHI